MVALQQLKVRMKKNKAFNPYLALYAESKPWWIIDITTKPNSIKTLKVNIEENDYDLEFCKHFYIWQQKLKKEKISKPNSAMKYK